MPTFRVGLHGENCLVAIEGEPQKLGFYTIRYIDSLDPREAGETALAAIYEELKAKVSNKQGDDPIVSVDEIDKASFFARLLSRIRGEPGFIWFPSETQKSPDN